MNLRSAVDGHILIEPSFEYNLLAQQMAALLEGTESPVVLEIGGGFGGLARQLLRAIPDLRYIGLDLPENLVLQAWYLGNAVPASRVEFSSALEGAENSSPGAALLPNWAIEHLKLSKLDLVINVRSFGEMTYATLGAYFSQIRRLSPTWIFHENLSGPRKDRIYGVSSTRYPLLEGYRRVISCESRWPKYNHASPYPCREELYLRANE
jgi:putative sugar O-methyltransferase